ncbi:unnamed protein product [Urochloa humidicola]
MGQNSDRTLNSKPMLGSAIGAIQLQAYIGKETHRCFPAATALSSKPTAEESSNSIALFMAGSTGEIVDSMRGLELSPPLQRQVGDVDEAGKASVGAQDSFPSSDWSQLQQDLLISIFSRLDFPDLVHSGAVCMPWHLSYSAVRRFRLCSPNQSPYIVYSSGDSEINAATLHNLSTNKMYHVSLPDPPFITRHVIGSSHGWLVTADEQSNLLLLNPITGAQIALPPAESIEGVRASFTAAGVLSGYIICYLHLKSRSADESAYKFFDAKETRLFLYDKAVLSSDPSSGNCTILLKHRPDEHLSFARIGDTKWTWIDTSEHCYCYDDIFYNDHDSLFYAIQDTGDIHTINISCKPPVVRVVLSVLPNITRSRRYILQAPWGDLLQVLRQYGPVPERDNQDSDDEYQSNEEPDSDEDLEVDVEDSEDDLGVNLEVDKVTVHMVDLAEQKFVEINNLRDHILFIGFNSSFMVHARDFPNLSPNCVYVTDDNKTHIHYSPFNGRRFGYLKLEDASLTELPFSDGLLQWPPPVWFRPHLT